MIYRTWLCLNRYCLHENTVADADHPPCPACGGLKVKWLPKAVAIKSARTNSIDNTVAPIGRSTKNLANMSRLYFRVR